VISVKKDTTMGWGEIPKKNEIEGKKKPLKG